MIEDYLHYLWKFQLFQCHKFITTEGEKVKVNQQGVHNKHAGPDFKEAKITINNMAWCGHVEIHVKSSDWYQHGHQHDPAYDNVVLHVVWSDNQKACTSKGVLIPTIEIEKHADLKHWRKYRDRLPIHKEIPCGYALKSLDPFMIEHLFSRSFLERMEEKSKSIAQILNETNGDWIQTAWQVLAKSFGFSSNGPNFSDLADSIPWQLIERYKDDFEKLLALLFGQAGLLYQSEDNKELILSFKAIQKLHALHPMNEKQWNFGRVHPNNFPTKRLYQLTACLYQHGLSYVLEPEKIDQDKLLYSLTKEVPQVKMTVKGLKHENRLIGKKSAELILFNAHLSLGFARGKEQHTPSLLVKIMAMAQDLSPEDNYILRKWKAHGVEVENITQTQALLWQFHRKCSQKKCLNCLIGSEIFKNNYDL